MKSKLINLIPIWALFVGAFYFMNHFDLLAPINPELSAGAIFSFFVFVVTLLVGVAAGLIVLIDGDRRLKKFKLNIFHGFLIFFLFSLLLVMGRFLWSNSYLYEGELSYIQYEDSVKVYEGESIVYEDVVLKPGDTVNDYAWAYEITGEADVFNKISFLEALFNAALYLAIPFIGILLFWLVFYALGALFYNWGKKPSVDLSGILFSIGIGAALMSFFGFGLALVGLFYPWPFLLLAGVSLVLGKRHVQALYVFCKKKLAIPLKKISWLSFGMGAILLLLLSISFVLASASVPSGFDDFGYYMNLPNLIANTHGFVHYYGLYGFAILQAVAISFQGTTGLAQVLTFSFGVLSLLLIYVFTAAFLNKKLAFFMAVVLATVPFFAAHSSIELKVELPLLFYGGLSFLSFYYFTKKNQTKWLVLSGLMAGFAVLIKLTAVLLVFALVFLFFSYYWKLRGGLLAGSIILFVISFLDLGDYGFMKETGLIVFGVISVIGLIVLGAHVLRKDKKLKKRLGSLALLFGMMIVPTIPWVINSFVAAGGISMSAISGSGGAYFEDTFSSSNLTEATFCSTESDQADFSRYTYSRDSQIKQLLFVPWDISITTSPLSPLVNISFLLLAFLPVLLVFCRCKLPPKKDPNAYWLLIVGGGFYWFIWALAAQNVLWYGIAGFSLLWLALAAALYVLFKHNKWTQVTTLGILIVWVLFGVFVQVNFYFSRTPISNAYMTGLIDYEKYVDNRFPEYLPLASFINEDPEAKVYLTNNNFFLFFIEENHSRVFKDRFLSTYLCLSAETEDTVLVERFRDLGFTYFVLGQPVYDSDFPDDLRQASSEFLNFAERNFYYLGGNTDTHVFQIPLK